MNDSAVFANFEGNICVAVVKKPIAIYRYNIHIGYYSPGDITEVVFNYESKQMQLYFTKEFIGSQLLFCIDFDSDMIEIMSEL